MAAADGEAAAEGEWRGGKAASAMSKEIKTLFTNEQIAAILPHRWVLAVCLLLVWWIDGGDRQGALSRVVSLPIIKHTHTDE